MSKKFCCIVFLLSLVAPCCVWAEYEQVIIQVNGSPLLVIKKYYLGRITLGVRINRVPYQQPQPQGVLGIVKDYIWHAINSIYPASGSHSEPSGNYSEHRGFSRELLQNLITFSQALGNNTLLARNILISRNMEFSFERSRPGFMELPTANICGSWTAIFEESQSEPNPLNVLFNPYFLEALTSFAEGRDPRAPKSEPKITLLQIPQTNKLYLQEPGVTISFSEVNDQLIINLEGVITGDQTDQRQRERDDDSRRDDDFQGKGAGASMLNTESCLQ